MYGYVYIFLAPMLMILFNYKDMHMSLDKIIFVTKHGLPNYFPNYYSFIISVTNEATDEPVVSPVSGCVFERRNIEKFVAENGIDPTNGKDLQVDQLIAVRCKITNNIFLIPLNYI